MKDAQEILDRVVAHMMEENKDEIAKAWENFYHQGSCAFIQEADGRVTALPPIEEWRITPPTADRSKAG